MHLQQQEKIRYLGLTNFDTEHLIDLVEKQGAPIVSNQVIFYASIYFIHHSSNNVNALIE